MLHILTGYFLLGAFFPIHGDLKWLALIGIAPLVAGLIGWCPVYAPFGIRTCARRS